MRPFFQVKYLRSHGRAATPIVLSEGTPYGNDWAQTGAAPHGGNPPKNLALSAAYRTLVGGGDKQLFYAKSEEIFASTLGLDSVAGSLVDPTVVSERFPVRHTLCAYGVSYRETLAVGGDAPDGPRHAETGCILGDCDTEVQRALAFEAAREQLYVGC
jgi:hypothetical protein